MYLSFLCLNRNIFAFSAEVLDENNNIYTHEDDVFEGLKLKACVASMHQNTVRDLTNYSFIVFSFNGHGFFGLGLP